MRQQGPLKGEFKFKCKARIGLKGVERKKASGANMHEQANGEIEAISYAKLCSAGDYNFVV